MPSRDAADAFALLNTALRDAGWLVPMELVHTAWGPRILIEGLSVETATELALTIQAGLERRVVQA
jgi:hypothetical protein